MEDFVLEMRNITKSFPGIKANDNVTLQLKKQEVHALLGENGAGKSTLMSILFGLYHPDEGEIVIHGKPVKIKNPNEATANGIGMVHQHFKLVQNFTALENIVLGMEDSKMGLVTMNEAREKLNRITKQYDLELDLDMKIEDMTVGMQQRVEILKMLYRDSEILIFDEPTAVLTPQEIEGLMRSIEGLVEEGKSVIFISHKLNEIMRIADRCTILRRGKGVGTVNIAETSIEELSRLMVGRDVALTQEKDEVQAGDVLLSVRNLTINGAKGSRNVVNDVSFDVKAGEIVCIAGIDGNGQTELVHGLTGLRKIDSGSIVYNGVDYAHLSIRQRNDAFLSHIPEDRHKYGLVLDYNISENLMLQTYYKPEYTSHGFLSYKAGLEKADEDIEKYDIRCGQGATTIVRSMSGGNQQKVIIARELERQSEILIAVQPTRGLDVGAIEFIHKQLLKSRDEGRGVLLVSLELDEVMNLSDRILVMYEGEIVGEFLPQNTDYQELGLYMSGAKREKVSV